MGPYPYIRTPPATDLTGEDINAGLHQLSNGGSEKVDSRREEGDERAGGDMKGYFNTD